jgi:hypothetical protein
MPGALRPAAAALELCSSLASALVCQSTPVSAAAVQSTLGLFSDPLASISTAAARAESLSEPRSGSVPVGQTAEMTGLGSHRWSRRRSPLIRDAALLPVMQLSQRLTCRKLAGPPHVGLYTISSSGTSSGDTARGLFLRAVLRS